MLKRAGPLSEATALAWICQIMNALEYLHRQQPPIIHRDVKPGNIKITPEGKAVLVDFGIAKVYDPRQATLTGARAVTPGYAPPEQYSLHTTERSDIYALGATLYTMLTGRVPPEAPMRTSGEETFVPPSQVVPGKVSPPTEGAILQAMELETSKRWQNVAQLRVALEGRGAVPRLEPAPVPTGKPTVPLPTRGAPSAAILLLVVAFGVILLGGLAVISFLSQNSSRGGATPTPVPTITLIPTTIRTPTYTPKPVTVLPTATRTPTSGRGAPTWTAVVPTPTAALQINPTATRPPETPTTMPTKTSIPRPTSTAVPAVKRPWFGPLSFCLQIDANNRCINPTARLPADTTKFYVSWEFADIPDGTSFDRIWYYNGKELKHVSVKWDSGGSPTGFEFTWYQYNAGFATGEYRVDMYINGELLRSGSVQIGP